MQVNQCDQPSCSLPFVQGSAPSPVAVGSTFEVDVTATTENPGATITGGTVRLLQDGTEIDSQTFSSSPAVVEFTAPEVGEFDIEIVAQDDCDDGSGLNVSDTVSFPISVVEGGSAGGSVSSV